MKPQEATKRFYDLVWPQMATVLRVARILVGNHAEAEDLAQETMLKAFKGIDGFDSGTNVKAWLMTILRRARVDRLRAASSAAGTVSLQSVDFDPECHEQSRQTDVEVLREHPEEVLNSLSDQHVIDALQRLPEDIRLTLLLVDVEGMPHEDAATILEVPVGTIKSRTHRGRAMLREVLLPMARDLRLVRD